MANISQGRSQDFAAGGSVTGFGARRPGEGPISFYNVSCNYIFFNPRGTGSAAEHIALVGYVSPLSSSEPNWSQIDVRGGYRKLSE